MEYGKETRKGFEWRRGGPWAPEMLYVGRGGVGTNLGCEKRSPELGFGTSHKKPCDLGQNLSLPWIPASCSVQGEGLETLDFVT